MLSDTDARALLSKLCIELGFCLPPSDQERLAQAPPSDVRGFVDAVFMAEGLDPSTVDRHIYRQVRDMVCDAFDKGGIAQEGHAYYRASALRRK
jgi:hypothetical protein